MVRDIDRNTDNERDRDRDLPKTRDMMSAGSNFSEKSTDILL